MRYVNRGRQGMVDALPQRENTVERDGGRWLYRSVAALSGTVRRWSDTEYSEIERLEKLRRACIRNITVSNSLCLINTRLLN